MKSVDNIGWTFAGAEGVHGVRSGLGGRQSGWTIRLRADEAADRRLSVAVVQGKAREVVYKGVGNAGGYIRSLGGALSTTWEQGDARGVATCGACHRE